VTNLRVDQFRGSVPLRGDWQLDNNQAARAQNCRVRSGDIEPLVLPTLIHTFSAAFGAAYRVPASSGDLWMSFDDPATTVVEAPLVNDAYGRVYWTSPGQPLRYTTRNRLSLSQPPLTLGLSNPNAPLTVTPISAANNETRAYLYTRVSVYGEESGPSPVASASGDPTQVWTITGFVPDPGEANKSYSKVRLYRTVTGYVSSTYFLVAELPNAGLTTYVDTKSNVAVAQSTVFQAGIFGPPEQMDGIAVMPNGFLAGFRGRDLMFSTPWQPHSWPVNYTISVADTIVALAVVGNVLFILTNGTPYMAQGVNPESISLSRIQVVAPCAGMRSVVVHPVHGVIYASHNGLYRMTPGSVDLVTRDQIDERRWRSDVIPATLTAVLDDIYYTGMNAFNSGFMIDISDGSWFWTDIPVDRLWIDVHSGAAMASRGNRVYNWNPVTGLPANWLWLSKKFDLASPINIGAVQVRWDNFQLFNQDQLDAFRDWNVVRITRPLSAIGYLPIGGVYHPQDIVLDPDVPDNRTAIGGSPLFADTELVLSNSLIWLRLYTDQGLTWDAAVPGTLDNVMRPRSGDKSRYMQFQLSGTSVVHSIAMAETGQELSKV
jgi:hypothetical protein